MRLTLIAALFATAFAGTAAANSWFGPPNVTLEQAAQKAQVAGYTEIRSIEFDDGAWEIGTRRPDGSRLTVFIDGQSGDILSPEQPGQKQLTAAEVMTRLAAAGHSDVRELEREDGFWNAEVRSGAGFTREVRVHPISGAVSNESWND